MDARRLKALRKELNTFESSFAPCIKTEPSRGHFRTYVEGQLSDLERKNVAAIALNAGVPPRTLREFVGLHVWDHLAARDELQRQVMARHADPNAIAEIDETSFAKKGDRRSSTSTPMPPRTRLRRSSSTSPSAAATSSNSSRRARARLDSTPSRCASTWPFGGTWCSAWSASCSSRSRRSGFGGKNPWWSLAAVREVVEAQLDPQMSTRERTHRLRKVLARIKFWQESNRRAESAHCKRRRRELRLRGIRLSLLRKCFHVF